MKHTVTIAISLIAITTLSACGGSGGGGGSPALRIDTSLPDGTAFPGDTSRWGFVEIIERVGDTGASGNAEIDAGIGSNRVRISADFGTVADAAPVNRLQQEFLQPAETCTVAYANNFNVANFPPMTFRFSGFDAVSAGEIITFSSPEGTFGELVAISLGDSFFRYRALTETLAGNLPQNLSFDVPGEDFPAMSNVSVPNVATFNLVSPESGATVTPSTTFSWVAGSDPDAVVAIKLFGIDIYAERYIRVNCIAEDDGSFSFPTSTQQQMGENFSAYNGDIGRRTTRIAQQNGAAVIIMNYSGYKSLKIF